MSDKIKIICLPFVFVFIFSACEVEKQEDPPALPPYESLTIDFNKFTVKEQQQDFQQYNQTIDTTHMSHYQYAATQVGFWSLLTGLTLAVPVAAFYHSFNHEADYLGDNKWQWEYEVPGFAKTYFARLTGEIIGSSVKWEMYLEQEGIGGHPEFKWFEGTSDIQNENGQWTLFHSYEFQEKVLEMEWKRDGSIITQSTYNYVRELTNNRETDPSNGNKLIYGIKEGDFDAYFDIHYYDFWKKKFVDVDIEWSSIAYEGQVLAPAHFNENAWHCWNEYGYNKVCN